MNDLNPIFDEHYQDYCSRISSVNIESVSERLGLLPKPEGRFILPFFTEKFQISPEQEIRGMDGNLPTYTQLVVMARYLLNCPDQSHEDNQWVAFKDFKMVSHFTNVNFFKTDTEAAIAKTFAGQASRLEEACRAMGGITVSEDYPYDLAYQFTALPRISLLVLFNDRDSDFPADCTVLFPKHAEWYLDPEALAVTSSYLARRLRDDS